MKLSTSVIVLAAFWAAFFVSGGASASRLGLKPTTTVVSALPASPTSAFGYEYVVEDAQDASDCTTGGGAIFTKCIYNGTAWVSVFSAQVVAADHIDAITEIAAALRTGSDGQLVTGTPGTPGHCAEWDANGDLVSAGAACGTGGGGLTADSVGTSELDDDADTPGSGEYVRVDTTDQAGFEYRTAAETRTDLGVQATPVGANQVLFLDGSGNLVVIAGLTFDGTTFTAPRFLTPSVDGENGITVFDNPTAGFTGCAGLAANQLGLFPDSSAESNRWFGCSNSRLWEMVQFGLDTETRLLVEGKGDNVQLHVRGTATQQDATDVIFQVTDPFDSPMLIVRGDGTMRFPETDPNSTWGTDIGGIMNMKQYQFTPNVGGTYDVHAKVNITNPAGTDAGDDMFHNFKFQQKVGDMAGFGTRLDMQGDDSVAFHPLPYTGSTAFGYEFFDDDDSNGLRLDVPDLTADETHEFRMTDVYPETTTARTVLAGEMRGSIHVATNAGTVTFTLPDADTGMEGCFLDRDATAPIRVDPQAGENIIQSNGDEMANGEYLEGPLSASTRTCLVAIDDTTWQVMNKVGTWVQETP